tara:strand:- start:220 stop:648 length:429 start_codon:yes stop_codon:yes gene_type:complete
MSEIENLIYNLNQKSIISTPNLFENQYKGLIQLVKGLVFILPSLYFLYKYHFANQRKSFKDINDIADYINEYELFKTFSTICQGISFLVIGYFVFYHYKANNNQKTLALLIKYLQTKKIISSDFFDIIKIMKPDGLGNINKL